MNKIKKEINELIKLYNKSHTKIGCDAYQKKWSNIKYNFYFSILFNKDKSGFVLQYYNRYIQFLYKNIKNKNPFIEQVIAKKNIKNKIVISKNKYFSPSLNEWIFYKGIIIYVTPKKMVLLKNAVEKIKKSLDWSNLTKNKFNVIPDTFFKNNDLIKFMNKNIIKNKKIKNVLPDIKCPKIPLCKGWQE